MNQFKYKEEDGTASIIALVFLMFSMAGSISLFYFAQNEAQTYRRFDSGLVLQLDAQNAIHEACACLEQDPVLYIQLSSKPGQEKILFDDRGKSGKSNCRVYGKIEMDKIILLSVAKMENQRMRAIAYLTKNGNHYCIDHWEH